MDAILEFNSHPWDVFAIVGDIKLFLKDYPYNSEVWISCLGHMATAHESAHWIYNIIKSGMSLVFEIPPSIKVICNHE